MLQLPQIVSFLLSQWFEIGIVFFWLFFQLLESKNWQLEITFQGFALNIQPLLMIENC